MSIASQITTMQEHIEDIYDTFAVAGVDTSAAAKNIVNINANLKERLEYYLANGLDVVWDNWSKVSGSGTTLSLNNTIQAKMDFVYKGNTSQSILPSGYTQVDYIESSGTQYIDTGYTPVQNDEFEIKNITSSAANNSTAIISAGTGMYQLIILQVQNTTYYKYFATGDAAQFYQAGYDNNTIVLNRDGKIYVDGELKTTSSYGEAVNSSLNIFRRADRTSYFVGRIGELIITNNNVKKIHFIPCYRNSDNVIGMYDIVNNIFYTNSGTGNFTYGSVAPNPDYPYPVNVVTGDNEVKVEGKNIGRPVFDSGFYILGTGDNRKVASRVSDKCGEIIKVKPSTNYTISGTFTSFADSVVRIALFDAIPVIDSVPTDVKNTNNQLTFTTGTNTNYVLLYDLRARSVTANDLFVCETQYASTYEPYQSQTYPINLGVKNLIDLINFASINNNTVVSLIDNGINVNNVSGGYGAKITIENLTANTNYYLSYNWKSISNGVNGVVVFAGTGTSTTLASFYNLNGGTFNTGDNTTINIWFYAAIPGIAEVEYTNIQLEEGTMKHSYTPSWFTPMELCKIGDYQDYLYKENGIWYKYGAIGKVVLDGSENWVYPTQVGSSTYYRYENQAFRDNDCMVHSQYLSDNFKYNGTISQVEQNVITNISIADTNKLWITIDTSLMSGTTKNDFKNWLSTHNTTVYYILNTPTITEITDTTLINQLEAIKLSYNEQTNISQTNADKPFILDVTALKDLDAEDTTPTLAINRGLSFTQPPVSENSINDEDDNSVLEETINEEEPNIEDDNREEEEPVGFFEKEIINNDEEQEEIPTEPIEIDNGQR